MVAIMSDADTLNAELKRVILSHGVRPYRGTRERISIASNFSLDGG